MSKIGIIVDGQGDYHSIRSRFLGQCEVLKTDGQRGHEAKVQEIVSGANKQISMLSACDCSPIIVLLDFEMRTVDYFEFVEELKKEFKQRYDDLEVNVAIPNRMIENWYLADIEYLSNNKVFLKNNIKQKKFEGTNGKEVLKTLFLKNYSYSETEHGPQLFKILRFDVARKNSVSFNNFLVIMEGT